MPNRAVPLVNLSGSPYAYFSNLTYLLLVRKSTLLISVSSHYHLSTTMKISGLVFGAPG